MLSRNLQFQLSNEERDVEIVMPSQILCVRQTATTLEFLREKPNGSTNVIVVEGINLGALRRALVNDLVTIIRAGTYGESWSRCFVTRIYGRLGWTIPKIPMAADPNPVPIDFLLMENGLVRDLWSYKRIDAFAVSRGTEEKFLLQFRNRHSYILAARQKTFIPLLRTLKESNLEMGTVNKFSAFAETATYPRTPWVRSNRHIFAAISYEERDRASRSEWNVILDFRSVSQSRQQTIGQVMN